MLKVAGAAISLGLLWLVLRAVDGDAVWEAVRAGEYRLVPLALILFLGMTGVRALLWGSLLGRNGAAAAGLYPHLMVGLLANNLLPGRLGEFVRAYSAGRAEHLPRTRVFSSIVLERVLDVLWLLGFATAAFAMSLPTRWPVRLAGTTASLLLLAAAGAALLSWKGPHLITLVSRLVPRRGRARAVAAGRYYLSTLFEGLEAFSSPARTLWILGLSGTCWALWTGFLATTLTMFEIELPLLGLVLLTGVINLGVLVPSAPGYVGPFQFACVQGLALFGVAADRGLGVSLVLHALWYVPTTLLGLWFLWRLGFGLRTLAALDPSEGAAE